MLSRSKCLTPGRDESSIHRNEGAAWLRDTIVVLRGTFESTTGRLHIIDG